MSAHVASLQEQVNNFYNEMNMLRAQLGAPLPPVSSYQQQSAIDPSLQSAFSQHRASFGAPQASPGAAIANMESRPKIQSHQRQPSFRGPTSSHFNFDVARSSLQTMGITSQNDASRGESGDAEQATREPSPVSTNLAGIKLSQAQFPADPLSKDPIWTISQDEALRLCRVWEDEMGMMYPILDINKVIEYAQKLSRFMEAAHRSGLMLLGTPGMDSMDDEDTNILKMVLATAMTVEGSGRSEQGQRLFEYVHPAIDRLLLGNVGIKGIRLLVLTVRMPRTVSRQLIDFLTGYVRVSPRQREHVMAYHRHDSSTLHRARVTSPRDI